MGELNTEGAIGFGGTAHRKLECCEQEIHRFSNLECPDRKRDSSVTHSRVVT